LTKNKSNLPLGRDRAEASVVDEVDQQRARLYALLGRFLARPPSRELLAQVAVLRGGGGSGDGLLGRALGELAELAGSTTEAEAEREYNALFIGVDRGELVPYASYYLTGFLNDRPLARLRQDMQALGLERAPGVAEPEDHVAALCEMMAGLITGAFGESPEIGQRQFFERNLGSWAGRFFGDLEQAEAAGLYRPLGAIGRLFIEIEADDWAAAPAASAPVSGAEPGMMSVA
jgi:TorA maturation chaperone TorD